MTELPTTRRPLRNVSIMAGLGSITGVTLHNFLHSMQAAQARKLGIQQCSLDLPHPETHGTFNSGGHLRRDGLNQLAIAGYGFQVFPAFPSKNSLALQL